MNNKYYTIEIYYPDTGWVPVRWAPNFDTREEAEEWMKEDHDWDGQVQVVEIEEEDDDVFIEVYDDELDNDGEHE